MSVGGGLVGVVLDASVALAWVIPGENSDDALRLRDLALEDRFSLLCPPTFWYEVANALWVSVRRSRMAYEDAQTALAALQDFMVESCEVDAATCLAVATEYQLAVYDAAYLVAAIDRGIPLWSLDRQLAQAATNVGIVVLPAVDA